MIIEVWDIPQNELKATPVLPSRSTQPLARTSIKASTSGYADLSNICLSISSLGSFVVFHSDDPLEKRLTGCVLIRSELTEDLTEKDICKGLQNFCGLDFCGFGSFHIMDVNHPREEDEVYIACDGMSVTLYKAYDVWTQLYTISLAIESDLDAAKTLFSSLRGQFCVWTGAHGVVSIWNLETKEHISYISVNGDSAGIRAHLSADGSLIAISDKGCISLYRAMSGIKLAEYREGLEGERYFEVILEKDHFMFSKPIREGDTPNVRYREVVNIRDMSVVRDLCLHKDYTLNMPISSAKKLFAYSQVRSIDCTVHTALKMSHSGWASVLTVCPFFTRFKKKLFLGLRSEHCPNADRGDFNTKTITVR